MRPSRQFHFPWQPEADPRRVESWSLDPGEQPQSFVLSLRAADGTIMSFALHTWQMEAISAMIGLVASPPPPRRLN